MATTTTVAPPATTDTAAESPERGWFLGRLGLRARVTLAFAIGAMLLSLSMSLLVITVTRSNLVSQREATATQQVFFNAQNVRSRIGPETSRFDLLSSLQTPEGSRPVLYEGSVTTDEGEVEERWTARDPEFGREALPPDLRRVVLTGTPAKMRYTHPTTGDKSLAIGIPIASMEGAYFEIVSLRSLDATLQSVSFTLFGASIATVLAGAALGWYASRRVLRPLDEVGQAARSLAGGRLDTRIRALVDADLEPIITSFNGMAGALEARIEKDAQFASDVSHELRSPLMTLQASLEVLENNRGAMDERSQSALDLLSEDLNRFRELVEDLLEISRFDAGVMQLELQEVLLRDFVERAVRMSGSDVAVTWSDPDVVDPEFGDVLCALDPRRIARVITNLLTNAEKYGEGAVAVQLDADRDEEILTIAVDDDGEGVPEEDRARIFERFNRAGAAHARGSGTGVGLGLALVAEHVALHGGSVHVTDAPGGGARFVVALPWIELSEEDGPA